MLQEEHRGGCYLSDSSSLFLPPPSVLILRMPAVRASLFERLEGFDAKVRYGRRTFHRLRMVISTGFHP